MLTKIITKQLKKTYPRENTRRMEILCLEALMLDHFLVPLAF